MRLIAIAATAILAACTPPPQPTDAQLAAHGLTQTDWAQCGYEAASAAGSVRGGVLYQAASELQLKKMCLQARATR